MYDEAKLFGTKNLDGFKKRLKITHNDEDETLKQMLASSAVVIATLVGASDFDGSIVELTFNRAMFDYNDALDEFMKLYRDEIENLYLTNMIFASEVLADDEG